jgi:hypothetical protein
MYLTLLNGVTFGNVGIYTGTAETRPATVQQANVAAVAFQWLSHETTGQCVAVGGTKRRLHVRGRNRRITCLARRQNRAILWRVWAAENMYNALTHNRGLVTIRTLLRHSASSLEFRRSKVVALVRWPNKLTGFYFCLLFLQVVINYNTIVNFHAPYVSR